MHVKATKLLNMPTIPCIAVDTLTASELKLLRIATNRLGENYGWRFNDLKLELEELIIDAAPIEVSGFELTKIYVIIEVAKLPPFELGPLVLETEQTPAAQSGDVFVMGRIGSTAVMRRMPPPCAA